MTRAAVSTVVVELTPAGRAAVAVVLVAGPEATRTVGNCFASISKRPLSDLPFGRIALGRWGGTDGEELIVCRRTEDQVEVHCHGGHAAIRTVIDDLVAHGCSQISWQEWLQRTAPDPLRAAAHIALASAPTARAAAVLLDQYQGALSNAIQSAIVSLAAGAWPPAAQVIDELWQLRDFGLHLTSPWRVVLAGAPNVGKSSLMNALAGYQRAIVSPLPGTTRDVVTLTTAIDGWPVQLADTAGLRSTDDELESAGVALADAAVADADLVILVCDTTADNDGGPDIISRLPRTVRVIQARNKIDLVPGAEGRCDTHGGGDAPARLGTSAVTGVGIAELIAAIGGSLVPVAPPPGTPVAFTADQFAKLADARAAIENRDADLATAALKALLSPMSDAR